MSFDSRQQGDRYINFEGITNARYLNGIVGAGGRKVCDNCFIRTATLAKATDIDVDRLRLLYHVATIIDFRSELEQQISPDRPIPGMRFVNLPVSDENGVVWERLLDYPGDPIDALVHFAMTEEGHKMSYNYYLLTVANRECQQMYAQFFDILLQRADEGAILWHCTHGKDRTGLATLFLLSALGTDEAVILHDFELTQASMTKRINIAMDRLQRLNGTEEDKDVIRTVVGANPRSLKVALDYAVQECGSILGYMEQKLNVTPNKVRKLRERFLQ